MNTHRRSSELVLGLFLFIAGCGGPSGGDTVALKPSRADHPDIEKLNQQFAAIRAGKSPVLPAAHQIKRMPRSRQINQLFCIIASTQMMLNYWGLNDQQQLQLAQAYAKANPDSPGRKKLAILDDAELSQGNWQALQTNFQGLMKLLNQRFGDRGKTYFWEYAGEEIPARHLQALKLLVANDIPVLVAAKTQDVVSGHCMVMTGYTHSTITVLNPTHGRPQTYSKEQFMKEFKALHCEWVSFVPESK
ncbi:MAG: C39 family peptidase [Planctomycetota bacterium]|jgi:hypothetical protein